MKSWLVAKIQGIGRRNLMFAALSVGITSIVMTGFLLESRWGYMKRDPLVVFMESWTSERSAKDVEAERARLKAELALWADATPEELQAGYEKFAAARAKEATARAQSALVEVQSSATGAAPAPATAPAGAESAQPAQLPAGATP